MQQYRVVPFINFKQSILFLNRIWILFFVENLPINYYNYRYGIFQLAGYPASHIRYPAGYRI
jgi:hypothetical protein